METPRPNADEMYCTNCGSIIKQQAGFCTNCGARISAQESAGHMMTSDKSRLAAGLLGILLGAWGIHRFYLGNIGIGIIQIIVTLITCGIGGIWGLIEGIIIIANGNWNDAQGRPLAKL